MGRRDPFAGLGRPSDPLPLRKDIRAGSLPSGLRYFILEHPRPANRASLRLVVNTGALHEEDHELGIAHFVEHMAYWGTKRFPQEELSKCLRTQGIMANAATGLNCTVYKLETPVEMSGRETKSIPPSALAILDEWSRTVTFNPQWLEKERLIIIEEHRRKQGPKERVRQEWLSDLLRGSRFNKRNPIGDMDIIKALTVCDLESFYKKWYRADNMALIFVGDFDGAALEASLTEHFLIEKPAVPTPQPVFDLAPAGKESLETLTFTDGQLTSTSIRLCYRMEGRPKENLAGLRKRLIHTLISRMMRARLKDSEAKADSSLHKTFAKRKSFGASSQFLIMESGIKRRGDTGKSLEELLSSCRGFSESEIAFAKEAFLSDARYVLLQEKDRKESKDLVKSLIDCYSNGTVMGSPEWSINACQHLLCGINARSINNAARKILYRSDAHVFIFAPESEKETLPDDARIREYVSHRARKKPGTQGPEKILETHSLLHSCIPQKGKVEKETAAGESGAVIWELGNGAHVVLKPTEYMSGSIALSAHAKGGSSCVPHTEIISAKIAFEMMKASGQGSWTHGGLSKYLALRKVTYSYRSGKYSRSLTASCMADDPAPLFELLHLHFTDPQIESEAVKAKIDSTRTAIALRGNNPNLVFQNEVKQILYGGHPLYKPLELADLDTIDAGTMRSFVRRALNPADFTFVFTGNLSPQLMRPCVETYIASIPPGETNWNTWTEIELTRPQKSRKHFYIGAEKRSTVYMAWFSRLPFNGESRIAIRLLEKYLSKILLDYIREYLGGVYSIKVKIEGLEYAPLQHDRDLVLSVLFHCDPLRAGELSDAAARVLEKLASTRAPLDFTTTVKSLRLDAEEMLRDNAFIAREYAHSFLWNGNLDFSLIHTINRSISAVTDADIQSILGGFLRNGPVEMVLMPITKEHMKGD